MAFIRSRYGASPLHFLAVVASFVVAAYAFNMIFKAPAPISTLTFLAIAVIGHDMIAFPLYSALNAIAGRAFRGGDQRAVSEHRVPPINYIRVPFILSAFFFVVFFPTILGLSSVRYANSTGLNQDVFFGRWLGICAGLFIVSAIVYAIQLRRHSAEPEAEEKESAEEDGAAAEEETMDQEAVEQKAVDEEETPNEPTADHVEADDAAADEAAPTENAGDDDRVA